MTSIVIVIAIAIVTVIVIAIAIAIVTVIVIAIAIAVFSAIEVDGDIKKMGISWQNLINEKEMVEFNGDFFLQKLKTVQSKHDTWAEMVVRNAVIDSYFLKRRVPEAM